MKTASKAKLDWLARAMRFRPALHGGKFGSVAIREERLRAGVPVEVVSVRNGVMTDEKPFAARFNEDLIVRSLEDADGVWMRDDPQEIWQMHESVVGVRGRVLVGGLGLGVWTRIAANMSKARRFVVVEKNSDVCSAAWEPTSTQSGAWESKAVLSLVLGDIADVLSSIGRREFDSCYLDTWRGTGVATWVEEVAPLRRLAGSKIGRVFCWAEQEMLWQVRGECWGQLYATLKGSNNRSLPGRTFVRELRRRRWMSRLKKVFDANSGELSAFYVLQQDQQAARLLDELLHVGGQSWERRFSASWDLEAETLDGERKASIFAKN